jgi:hypothetical protein
MIKGTISECLKMGLLIEDREAEELLLPSTRNSLPKREAKAKEMASYL